MSRPIRVGDWVRVLRNEVNAIVSCSQSGALRLAESGDVVKVREVVPQTPIRGGEVFYMVSPYLRLRNYLPIEDIELVESCRCDVLTLILEGSCRCQAR